MSLDLQAAFQEVSSSLKNLQQVLRLIEDVLRSTDFRQILERNEHPKPLATSSNCELPGRAPPISLFGLTSIGFSGIDLSFASRSDRKIESKELEKTSLRSADPNNNANPKRNLCICDSGKLKEDDNPPLHSSNHRFLGFAFSDLSTFSPSNGSFTMNNLINSIHSTDEKHSPSTCKCKPLPATKTSMPTEIVPASLSERRLKRTPQLKRKRMYLPFKCSHIGDDQPKQWTLFAADRLRLGFGLQDFIDSRKKAMMSKVLGFARVQGEPGAVKATAIEESSSSSSECSNSEGTRPLKAAINLLHAKLPSIDILKPSQLARILVEFMDRVPQIGRVSHEYPDKEKLFVVQDFFKYTEAEGKKLFEELDRDRDGQVTLEDLQVAMRKRRLPQNYAQDFLRKTRKHWFKRSIGWAEFSSLMEQQEPTMLRAFNSLCVSKSGTLQPGQLLSLLLNAGLPATEGNAAAMMQVFDADLEGVITYGRFRNFLLLLPSERLVDDPWMVWFEAATVAPMAYPIEIPAGNVLKSALSGGLACALPTALMYPLDTVKALTFKGACFLLTRKGKEN